jgi:hypothetical protein
LYEGESEHQKAYQWGLKYLPSGPLMEELVADVTLVFSPPKVGGSTITATVNGHPAVRPEAGHLHYLSDGGLGFLERQIAGCSHPDAQYLRQHLAQARGARVLLAANRALRKAGLSSVRKPRLITGVREPMALNLSLAFQGWWILGDRPEALDAAFLREWVQHDPWCRLCDNWFRGELGEVFGVNVYDRPFPTQRGWDVYENDEARVLVIRQENLTALPQALGALFELDPESFIVESRNEATNKEYASHYAAMKRAVRLTEAELDRLYGSEQVRHFYTPEEREQFKRRWLAGSERPAAPRTEAAPARAAAGGPACGHPTPATPGGRVPPHPWVCRPCPHCTQQLALIPVLEQACAERLALIQRLDADLREAGRALQELQRAHDAHLRQTAASQQEVRGVGGRLTGDGRRVA